MLGRNVELQTIRFFDLLFPRQPAVSRVYYSLCYLEFRMIKAQTPVRQIFHRFGSDDLGDTLDLVIQLNTRERYNVYFGPALRLDKCGTANCVYFTTCLWVDIDGSTKKLLTFRPKPSIIVNSGHGLHAYWLLKNRIMLTTLGERKDFTARLRSLVEATGADRAATDPCRVLRVPGTINWNPEHKKGG